MKHDTQVSRTEYIKRATKVSRTRVYRACATKVARTLV